jgi:hypothetical protein
MEQDRLFVHVNDSIRKLASEVAATETWDFICECPEATCHASVSLTLIEFDDHRAASPPVPVHAAEHDSRPVQESARSRAARS